MVFSIGWFGPQRAGHQLVAALRVHVSVFRNLHETTCRLPRCAISDCEQQGEFRMKTAQQTQQDMAGDIELSVATDQVCFIIAKARQFEVKDVPTMPDPASNASDDRMVSVLEARNSDPVAQEIREFVNALDEDQQIDLVALTWVGRGDYGIAEWRDAREQAAAAHNERTADYLLGLPLLSEFLEDALSDTGRSCEDEEVGRL
jgi:hypothetical protein